MIYLYLFIIIVIFLFVERISGFETLKTLNRWIFFVGCVIIFGFRYQCGPDHASYLALYTGELYVATLEPLFRFIIYLFNKQGIDFAFFHLFIALLSISIKVYILNKYSPYFFLSAIICFSSLFLGDMGQIRFSIAMAILWLSIPFLMERNLRGYLCIIVLAVSMHYSALIFLPVYWLQGQRIGPFIMLGIWTFCYLFSFTPFGSLLEDWALNSGVEAISSKAELYDDNDEFTERYGISIFGIASKILVVILLYYTNRNDEDKLQHLFLNIYFIGGCFFLLFSFNEILGSRFSFYFLSFEALAVPLALEKLKDKKLYYLLVLAFILKAFYQYYSVVYISYSDQFLPYRNLLTL